MAESKDKLQIRNGTVDFLVFTRDAHEGGIEVRMQDHDAWPTQKAVGQLFDVDYFEHLFVRRTHFVRSAVLSASGMPSCFVIGER